MQVVAPREAALQERDSSSPSLSAAPIEATQGQEASKVQHLHSESRLEAEGRPLWGGFAPTLVGGADVIVILDPHMLRCARSCLMLRQSLFPKMRSFNLGCVPNTSNFPRHLLNLLPCYELVNMDKRS